MDRWSTSVMWPCAIDSRLDQLIEEAIDAGADEKLARSELLAALVLAAPADGDALFDILRSYRRAKVRDTLLQEPDADGAGEVIRLAERRPGRKR